VSESSGGLDAGNPGCNPLTQYQLDGADPGGEPAWQVCDSIPRACRKDITCSCILAAEQYPPDLYPCTITSGGLVVISEAPESSGGS
jgi:hypothetical protein